MTNSVIVKYDRVSRQDAAKTPHDLPDRTLPVTSGNARRNAECVCPACGQPTLPLRLGVRLPPMKMRIFDLIQARPGITNRELCELVYGRVDPAALVSTRAHIGQTRELMMNSGFTIKGISGNGYWLRRSTR